MKHKPLQSAALLLLPILLLWGGKVYSDKFHTGISVAWFGSTGNQETPYACDTGATLHVLRVADEQWISRTVCDGCDCKAYVPAGKYEVIVISPAYGSNAMHREKVEVRDGEIASVGIYIDVISAT